MKVNQDILKKANKSEKQLFNLIKYTKNYKKCPEGKVLNTHTNRCIAIGSALYKTATKKRLVTFRRHGIENIKPKPKKVKDNTKDCKK